MKNADVITILPFACAVILQSCGGTGSASPSAVEPVVSENTTSISHEGSAVLLDNDTELQTSIQGFSVEHVYIVDGDDKKISNREIALSTRFSIVYEGVKNYTLKNGKAFPDLSIRVIDNDQKTVISEGDLLASYEDGLSEKDASVLRATITTGDPMKPGKYICSIHVVDKNNKDAFILSSWDFEVK
jgi:hypothetical protein